MHSHHPPGVHLLDGGVSSRPRRMFHLLFASNCFNNNNMRIGSKSSHFRMKNSIYEYDSFFSIVNQPFTCVIIDNVRWRAYTFH